MASTILSPLGTPLQSISHKISRTSQAISLSLLPLAKKADISNSSVPMGYGINLWILFSTSSVVMVRTFSAPIAAIVESSETTFDLSLSMTKFVFPSELFRLFLSTIFCIVDRKNSIRGENVLAITAASILFMLAGMQSSLAREVNPGFLNSAHNLAAKRHKMSARILSQKIRTPPPSVRWSNLQRSTNDSTSIVWTWRGCVL